MTPAVKVNAVRKLQDGVYHIKCHQKEYRDDPAPRTKRGSWSLLCLAENSSSRARGLSHFEWGGEDMASEASSNGTQLCCKEAPHQEWPSLWAAFWPPLCLVDFNLFSQLWGRYWTHEVSPADVPLLFDFSEAPQILRKLEKIPCIVTWGVLACELLPPIDALNSACWHKSHFILYRAFFMANLPLVRLHVSWNQFAMQICWVSGDCGTMPWLASWSKLFWRDVSSLCPLS